MRLVHKFSLAFLLGFLAIMGVQLALELRRDVFLFEEDTTRDERDMGRVLRSPIEDIGRVQGPQHARAVVDGLARLRTDVHVRWVRLGAPMGDRDAPILDPENRGPLRAGQEVTLVRVDDSGEERRFTYLPLAIKGAGRPALELSEALGRQRAFLRTTAVWGLMATLLVVFTTAALAFLLGRWFVGEPLRVLGAQARRVGAGDLSTRLRLRQRDEIGDLGRELDVMCDQLSAAQERIRAETEARLAAVDQLRHADRLKTVGQLSSGMAHELGTPLNVVAARAKMIAARAPSPEVAHNAEIIAQQAERMIVIIRHLLDFSRRKGPRLGTGELREIAMQTVEMLSAMAAARGVTLAVEGDEQPVFAQIDKTQLQQALANLIVNGIHASPRGSTLRVRPARELARPPADHGGVEREFAALHVADEGGGIHPDDLTRIFEPFFTTKGVGEGTGLGLAVSYGIVRDHGGWIGVDSGPGRGSRFTIYLVPAASAASRGALAV